MAERVLGAIERELAAEADDLAVRVVHRLGELAAGEASIVIAAASPRRDAAFAAARRALERVKREAPIWKHERYADGTSSWREEEPLAAPIR
jgi:molybdopterin synthase catalytic subunit